MDSCELVPGQGNVWRIVVEIIFVAEYNLPQTGGNRKDTRDFVRPFGKTERDLQVMEQSKLAFDARKGTKRARVDFQPFPTIAVEN
jgi:hypothetical protein